MPNHVATTAMTLVCTHCSRTNSGDARYCYFDGVSLLGPASPALAAHKTFLAPFVFESGVVCKDFDEFAAGCDRNWDAAVAMLAEGDFLQFFKGMGRMDLAQIAREAANFPDRDRGLDQFLSRLPTTSRSTAKLDVQPKLINLGTLKIGQNSQLELTLENQGSRLVYGSISSTCNWLTVTETGEAKLFQFRDSAAITIPVKGEHLRAGVKPLEGNLLLESNAGTFNLKVVVTVPVQPFVGGCLAGSRTPREIAEKAKRFPTEAGALFETGAVARWYEANGWIYPVQGPASTGVSAVQQFFEALGLSRPPKVFVAQPRIELKGKPGTKVSHQIVVRSDETRAVFAHAVSAADWCVVKPGQAHGNMAMLPVEIVMPTLAGERRETLVRITANGQQRFDVPVTVTAESVETIVAAATVTIPAPVQSAPKPATAVKKDAEPDEKSVAVHTPPFEPAQMLMHLAPVVVLAVLLFGLIVKDVLSDAPKAIAVIDDVPEPMRAAFAKEPDFKVVLQDEPDEGPAFVPIARAVVTDEPEERVGKQPVAPVKVEIKDEPAEKNGGGPAVAVAATPLVSYTTMNPPTRFGITGTAAAGAARFKQLTYASNGNTNTTVVSVNGGKSEFGSFQGRWTRKNQSLDKIQATPDAIQGSHSIWMWGPIAYHQVLEVVPGQPNVVNGVSRRNLDTVLVRWMIQNTDKRPHSAGLRMELDTLIGSNDGVPFTVPGFTGLVDTWADFRDASKVPDFIQALEVANLRNPGTIAHLTLKPGGGIEPAGRVSLTHWSTASLAWDIPIRNLTGDSSVIMYWPEKQLKAGESRTIGFAYGLGNVTSNDKLGLTLGGQFEPSQNFTATAYVENPIAGQTLRLELPAGLRRVEGAETQNVAMGGGKTAIVTWKVLVERTGEFKLKVISSTGLTQAKTINIARGAEPVGGKLAIDLKGSFDPGQIFAVIGKVTEPTPDQTLTLQLPAGLEHVGRNLTQRVPAPPPGSTDAVVQWQVRVVQPGKYPVRVSSSTGIAQTKTITIIQPTRAEGAFQILLAGDFAPGRAFTVSTKVANPVPDQKLTLLLPDGLARVDGNESQSAADGAVAWKVKIDRAGKFTVGVKSTTGVTQRKTVAIEPDQPGRFTFEFAGQIRPGRDFQVIAQVANPARDQTLTLVLPETLQLTKGQATQPVDGAQSVTWTVRVLESGRLPVRIESSTGLARTKTITLAEPSSTLFGR